MDIDSNRKNNIDVDRILKNKSESCFMIFYLINIFFIMLGEEEHY